MALRQFGECFKLGASKKVMHYNTYTYEHVKMGAASIQSALGWLSDSDKQQFLDNIETYDLSMDNQMFGCKNTQNYM